MSFSHDERDQKFSHLDYLEQVEGPEALEFARQNNRLSDERLKSDPRFESTYRDIFKIVSSKDKLPAIFLLNDELYNFWQDDVHVKGILRRTSRASFNTGKPVWETVLDVDQLAAAEGENWVYKGFGCLDTPAPGLRTELCMLQLSRGGKDASVLREFNLKLKQFVQNGFYVPESKSSFAWYDGETLLVADATESSTLTSSGYPSQIKVLKRGMDLTSAPKIYQSPAGGMSVGLDIRQLPEGPVIVITDYRSFYEADHFLYNLDSAAITRIPTPASAEFRGFARDQLLFMNREPLQDFPAGSLLALSLHDMAETASAKAPGFRPVFLPTAEQFFDYHAVSRDYLWVVALKDVQKQLLKYRFSHGAWEQVSTTLNRPGTNTDVVTASRRSEHLYVSSTGFLTPPGIFELPEAATAHPSHPVASSPAHFHASGLVTEQRRVRSRDGTEISYFIVHRQGLKLDGQNPTLLYGYGGFEIALTPAYSGTVGKVWLEKGGVYVLANIRGGGEYGPEWHRAGLRENRHKVYEDFYAVAEDLINRGVTSPRHLGIRGGSNGGLLTSVAFTQRPELFNAVISEVPLANMLEYHRWLAGASWMEEYGSPDDRRMREYLLGYSPLHNLAAGRKYPEVFYLTSTKDDRVHPAHARQMVARLQELGYPVLYNENTDGGHGRASNMKDTAEYLALEYTYLYQKLF